MGQDLKEELSELKSCILNLANCKNADELRNTAKDALAKIKQMENNPRLELANSALEKDEIIQDLKDQLTDIEEVFEENTKVAESKHKQVVEKLKQDLEDANNTIKLMAEQEHGEAVDKIDGMLGTEIMDKLTSVELVLNSLAGSVGDVEMLTKKMNLVNNSTSKTVTKLLNADANLADLVRSHLRKSDKALEEVNQLKKDNTSINSRINTVNEEYNDIVEQNSEITSQLEETNDLVDTLKQEVNEAKEEVKGFREIFRKISSFFGNKIKE